MYIKKPTNLGNAYHVGSLLHRLVDEGYSPSYGARPLRRAIMRLLQDSLAERILAGEIVEGDTAIVDVDTQGRVTVLNGQGVVLSGTAIGPPSGIA
eukprot:3737106-Pyramimonas_sp.AAC.1